MNQEIIIWASIIVGGIVIVGIHIWLHKLVKFKMDESTIVTLLKSLKATDEYIKAEDISNKTQIPIERISAVCSQSKLMMSDKNNEDLLVIKLRSL